MPIIQVEVTHAELLEMLDAQVAELERLMQTPINFATADHPEMLRLANDLNQEVVGLRAWVGYIQSSIENMSAHMPEALVSIQKRYATLHAMQMAVIQADTDE